MRNQPRGPVELRKSFFQMLVILQFEPVGIRVAGLLEIVSGGNAVDAAGHAIAARDDRSVAGGIVLGKRGNAWHCRQQTNRENETDGAHSV